MLDGLPSNTLFFDPIVGGEPVFICILSTFILVGLTSISLHLNNSLIWDHFIKNFGILQFIIFAKQSRIFAMSSASLLGSLVWGHHMYAVDLDSDKSLFYWSCNLNIFPNWYTHL